jgi:hypothetical protein
MRRVRSRAITKTHDVMAELDPAIHITLNDMCFLLLDGPIKSGHDDSKFVGREDFRSFYRSARYVADAPPFHPEYGTEPVQRRFAGECSRQKRAM